MNLDLVKGSIQVETNVNEWDDRDYDVFIFGEDAKWHFVANSNEDSIYVSALKYDGSTYVFNQRVTTYNPKVGYKWVRLPKDFTEKELTTACVEYAS